jgi:type IV pilus assembly protein PilO
MNIFKTSILAIIMVIAYSYAVSEGYVELKKTDEELISSINDMEEKIEALKKITTEAKLSEDISDLRKEVYDQTVTLQDDISISKILNNFSDISKESGLQLLLFEPKVILNKGSYLELPIKIKLRGTFRQTGNFLFQISKLSYLTVISDLSIKGIIGSSGYVINETEAVISIYNRGV